MRARIGVTAAVLLLFVGLAAAQSGPELGGTVRDTSGAVLPGVTVTAESPSLGEKGRSITTNSRGTYRLVDLPAGSYDITFTLEGFTTLRRENVGVGPGQNDPLDAVLRVATRHDGPHEGGGIILISGPANGSN
jgi:hypothetical protein